jgi:hypothetical protein
MYGDSWQEKPSNLPGSPQLPIPDEIAERYPALARCLCGEFGDGSKERPSIPPATLFVSTSVFGLTVVISPRDYPQVGHVTLGGSPGAFLEALEDALVNDHIAWKDRWKPSPRR